MTIGERVLELVHEKGMTQKEFSEKTGIPQSTMSSWKGKKQNPSIDKLKVICDTLKVDPYYLISATESNTALNEDYIIVYRNDEEYNVLVEYRKLDRERRNRLVGYIDALTDNTKKHWAKT
jgi:transcriptional regulator with XRE-family HTH domain